MATTTPNYGWPVPTSTDYVKDGATAIEALGDAIDATVFGLPAGLKLINSTSFSAVASQSINDVFSATYKNYLIITTATTSADTTLRMRMRVSAADNTSSNYSFNTWYVNANGASAADSGASQTSILLGQITTVGTISTIDITNPFATANTTMTINTVTSNTVANAFGSNTGGAGLTVTTSYTGFTMFPAAGTMTGLIQVYGYGQ
jgi:hypothetical protein